MSNQEGSITQAYDGDGRRARRIQVNTDPASTTTTYYLTSSALGGAVLSELNAQGGKVKTNVYANGEVIATQNVGLNIWGLMGQGVQWQYADPVTGSTRGDFYNEMRELDPLGVDAEMSDPYPQPEIDRDWPLMQHGEAGNPQSGCVVDGMPMACSYVYRLVGSGIAAQCPNNDCGPRSVRDASGNPIGWAFFRAGAGAAPSGFYGSRWVSHSGLSSVVGADEEEGAQEHNRAGHWESLFVSASAGSLSSLIGLPQNSKPETQDLTAKFNDCVNRAWGGRAAFGNAFDVSTAYLIGNVANGDANRSAMIGAIWAKESSFLWRPRGDHGPAQLTDWWSRNHRRLIVEGAYDPFTRPANSPRRDRAFTGDVVANVQTLNNIIEFSLSRYNGSFERTAYWYGPPTDRSAYAQGAVNNYNALKPFFDCFLGN